MTLALLDCPTGLAGNMLLAALFDLGLPLEPVEAPLAALGLADHYRLELETRRSGGLRGLHLEVRSLEPDPPHRTWSSLRQQLEQAPLAPPLRQRVLAVFTLLAEAEAAVHGHPPEAVHFHEVGALDALVDIVGVCAGLLHFGVERLICTPPPMGHGSVATAHGLLPLPAPAVLEIARRRAIPLAASGDFPAAELTTPTGLALAACWAECFGPHPAHLPRQVGVGLGSRRLDRPNLLRLILASPAVDRGPDPQADSPTATGLPAVASAEPAAAMAGEIAETVLLQQSQIDDASGEDLAFLIEALRAGGALEVFSQPIAMKKGRPGVLLSVLAQPQQAAQLRRIWWQHSTTLGVRESLQRRWRLPRSSREINSSLGPVRCKVAPLPGGGERLKWEYEDLAGLARRHGLSLAEIRRRLAAEPAGSPAAAEAGEWSALPPPPPSPAEADAC
jgi:uncharacterized protein (TIGR00299 family) protein